jgi:signal transduction histidine kinase
MMALDLLRALAFLVAVAGIVRWGPRAIGRESTVFLLTATLSTSLDVVCNVWRDLDGSAVDHTRGYLYVLAPIAWSAFLYALRVQQERDAALRAQEELRSLAAVLDERVRDGVAEARAANEELEALLGTVSHDLRAPLRTILGFTDAIEEDAEALEPVVRSHLARVRAAAGRMDELLGQLLELTRLTRHDLARQPVDLSALAEGILRDLQLAEPHRRVEVHVQPGLQAACDPILVRTILENLLGNAWKFTRDTPAPRIGFGRETVCGILAWFVRDNGVGFEPSAARRLFAPFQRLHGAAFPGTGIGLASVQRASRRHGGHAWAESQGPGGATFWFTLGPGDLRNGHGKASAPPEGARC